MKSPRLAIIVHSCDAYQLLWPGFFHFFERYGGGELPWPVFLLTEKNTAGPERLPAGAQVLASGEGEWSDRLQRALRGEVLRAFDWILYLQEDFWLKRAMDAGTLEFFLQRMAQEQWPLLKLHGCRDYRGETVGRLGDFPLQRLDLSSSYLMSHQASLWHRPFLCQQLPAGESPWQNERRGTRRLRRAKSVLYQVDYFCNNSNPPLGGVFPPGTSAYDTVSDRGQFNDYSDPLIQELEAEEELRAYAQLIRRHRQEGLNHRGELPRGRKLGGLWRQYLQLK